jgi:general secretion pathway protein G
MRDFGGFSLLEMMAVVTFILLLASFAMPSFLTIAARAHKAVLREDLFTMRSQIDRFTHDKERGTHPQLWGRAGRMVRGHGQGLDAQ